MNALGPLSALPLALLPAGEASTDYSAERSLHIVAETTLELEVVAFSLERDGEPVNRSGGTGTSLEERTVEQTFRVLEHEDGTPQRVQRVFDTVAQTSTSESDGETSETESDGPLAGLTLELEADEGDVTATVVEGSEPSSDAILEGHSLTLALDALLPEGEVAEDDSWELETDAVMHALGLDLEDALFPRPERDESATTGRGGRRGGGGGGGSRGSAMRNLLGVEWEGTATWKGETEYDGQACHAIELEIEGEGEMDPPGFSGGRRGRDRAPGALGTPGSARVVENTISCELEGRLLFSVDSGYPLLLSLEGSVSILRENEMQRGGGPMTVRSEREGAFEHRVVVSVDGDE
ncbi:MAG: hypothetical protein AAF682_21235 [Planctomycetota bacterium]